MPQLFAICTNNHIYPSGIEVSNSSNFSVTNIGSTCPICNKVGLVLEGEYSAHGEILELIRGPHFTVQILRKIQSVLQKANKQNWSENEVISKLTPTLRHEKQFLKSLKSAFKFLGVQIALPLLISILSSVITQKTTPQDIGRTAPNMIFVNPSIDIEINFPNAQYDGGFDKSPKQAYNKKCWCERDLPYKRCHGMKIYEITNPTKRKR